MTSLVASDVAEKLQPAFEIVHAGRVIRTVITLRAAQAFARTYAQQHGRTGIRRAKVLPQPQPEALPEAGFDPVTARGGSPEKIEAMRRRVEAGLPVFHPSDAADDTELSPVTLAASPVAVPSLPYRVLSKSGRVLGRFDNAADATAALTQWSQAHLVAQGSVIIARREDAGR